MTKMEVIEWLNSYQTLEERSTRLENKLFGVKGVSYGEKLSDNLPRTIVDNLHDLDMYKQKMDEILNVINSIEDNTLQILLKYKYIDNYSLQYIANNNLMGYALRTLKRLHNKAIDEVVKIKERRG